MWTYTSWGTIKRQKRLKKNNSSASLRLYVFVLVWLVCVCVCIYACMLKFPRTFCRFKSKFTSKAKCDFKSFWCCNATLSLRASEENFRLKEHNNSIKTQMTCVRWVYFWTHKIEILLHIPSHLEARSFMTDVFCVYEWASKSNGQRLKDSFFRSDGNYCFVY